MIVTSKHLKFVWNGGPYIDVYNKTHVIPHNNINVWDYKKGEPSIDFSADAMIARVREWLTEPEDTSDIW